MRGSEIPSLGPILSRFCRDPSLSRDKPPHSGSYGPLGDHTHHITNVNDDGTIPAVPVLNHEQYNSFRAADLTPPDGADAIDLTLAVLEPCVLECADGKLIVQVHVGNEGLSATSAPAMLEVIGLLAGQPVTTMVQEVPVPLAAGQYTAAFAFELPATGIDSVQVTVSSGETECDTMNNTVTLAATMCP